MVSILIRDEEIGGKVGQELRLDFEEETITLEELITRRVYEEVKRYNEKNSGVFRGLIQPEASERILNGYKLKKNKKIDAEKQSYIALSAFQKGGFFVIVGERQAEDLRETITLTDRMPVSFIKLTPLAGG